MECWSTDARRKVWTGSYTRLSIRNDDRFTPYHTYLSACRSVETESWHLRCSQQPMLLRFAWAETAGDFDHVCSSVQSTIIRESIPVSNSPSDPMSRLYMLCTEKMILFRQNKNSCTIIIHSRGTVHTDQSATRPLPRPMPCSDWTDEIPDREVVFRLFLNLLDFFPIIKDNNK